MSTQSKQAVYADLLRYIVKPQINVHLRNKTVVYRPWGFRAFYDINNVHVAQDESTDTLVHEVGHHIENSALAMPTATIQTIINAINQGTPIPAIVNILRNTLAFGLILLALQQIGTQQNVMNALQGNPPPAGNVLRQVIILSLRRINIASMQLASGSMPKIKTLLNSRNDNNPASKYIYPWSIEEQRYSGSYPATGSYTSKFYDGGSTEVMSMSLQYLSHPRKFRRLIDRDPQQAAFILRILQPMQFAQLNLVVLGHDYAQYLL